MKKINMESEQQSGSSVRIAIEASKTGKNILSLPNEVLELILRCDYLDYSDICIFAKVCKSFQDVSKCNNIWKSKLRRRWPNLLENYPICGTFCWLKEFQDRFLFGQKVRALLDLMSPQYHDVDEISYEEFNEITVLMETHKNGWIFLIDELMEILHRTDRFTDLTSKYYCKKVLRHIQHRRLKEKWLQFFQKAACDQKLETGAVMVAQWCQPSEYITENGISDQLDSIAWKVVANMKEQFPSHPICAMDLPVRCTDGLSWTPAQCKEILNALNHVLFNQMQLSGNSSNYYDEKNSYIDKVLQNKTGIPITLCLIYSSIAGRLDVICEPVNYPSHFLLRWKERPLTCPDEQYTYIDVFNGGKFFAGSIYVNQLQHSISSSFNIATPITPEMLQCVCPVKVFERMSHNLVSIGRQQGRIGDCLLCLRNALELFLAVSPDNVEIRLLQIRVNIHLNINLPEVIDSLQRIADLDQSRMGLVVYLMQASQKQIQENKTKDIRKKIEPKFRKDNRDVLFSVGTIMKHKRYNYTCVIYGWDSSCTASEEWIEQMGVDQLPNQQYQPFYNVLVEDGTNRYAAQENMLFTDDPKEITHPEIGRYFESYTGRCYIPNEEKRQEYPDDIDITRASLRQYKDTCS